MLKTLTLSLGVVLGACGVSMAGGHGKSMPSPQGPYPTSQEVLPSPQGEVGCGEAACAPKKKHCFTNLFKHKPKCYSYTWVLKKKKCHSGGLFGHKKGGCGAAACDSCGGGEVYPSGQYASPQGEYLPSGQTYGSGQASYGSGQAMNSTAAPTSATAPVGDEAPPAPGVAPTTPAPTTPPTAPQSSVLFLTPSGN